MDEREISEEVEGVGEEERDEFGEGVFLLLV